MTLVRCGLAFTLCLVVGCEHSVTDDAKEYFSAENTCPLERVEARERTDLKDSTFRTTAPPKDVAADPGRLAMWHEQQASRDRVYRIVQVRGCDKHVVYECRPARRGETKKYFLCITEPSVPAALSTW